ncbi:MAG: hypothetical protein AAFQ54_15955 [Pseudomonadota bacterium]
MSEDNVTNELLLETLKAMQTTLGEISNDVHDVHDVKADLRGVKGHMAAFVQAEVAQDGAIAAIQTRLERIERRLDLSES